MSRLRPSGPAPVLVAALVLGAATAAESGLSPGVGISAGVLVGALSTALAVAAAWWSPLGGMALLVATLPLTTWLADDLPSRGGSYLITLMVLVGYAGYRLPARRSAVAYALASVVVAGTIVASGEPVWEFVFFALILGPAWLVGWLLRREQARSAELARLAEALRLEREKQAEVAVAAERTRISRELHDAVAHTVSVMTLQVGVVRRRLSDRPTEESTLRAAEGLGRQAVDELRRIVGLVTEGETATLAPLPSLAHLDELLAPVRSTGTSVEAVVEGDLGGLPHAVDMSAYRIVQEALTNALRHAPGADVRVEVAVDRREVRLTVVDGGATRHPRPHPAGGHGTVGMRERASVLGGELEAGPEGAGYAVRARLPLAAPPARRAAATAEVAR